MEDEIVASLRQLFWTPLRVILVIRYALGTVTFVFYTSKMGFRVLVNLSLVLSYKYLSISSNCGGNASDGWISWHYRIKDLR